MKISGVQDVPWAPGVDPCQGSDNGDGSHGDGNHPEILEKIDLENVNITMFLMVWGGPLWVKKLPRYHIFYHANAQIMGKDVDRSHERLVFGDFHHMPS